MAGTLTTHSAAELFEKIKKLNPIAQWLTPEIAFGWGLGFGILEKF